MLIFNSLLPISVLDNIVIIILVVFHIFLIYANENLILSLFLILLD